MRANILLGLLPAVMNGVADIASKKGNYLSSKNGFKKLKIEMIKEVKKSKLSDERNLKVVD
jgi:hypothetical protein